MKRKLVIIIGIATVVAISLVSYFIYDYNLRIKEAKERSEKWTEDLRRPWRSYDLTQENAMLIINMEISNSNLSQVEKLNEQAYMQNEWQKANNQ